MSPFDHLRPESGAFDSKEDRIKALAEFLERAGAEVRFPEKKLLQNGADLVVTFEVTTENGEREAVTIPVKHGSYCRHALGAGKYSHRVRKTHQVEVGLGTLLQRGIAYLAINTGTLYWFQQNGSTQAVREKWVEIQTHLLKQRDCFGLTKVMLEIVR